MAVKKEITKVKPPEKPAAEVKKTVPKPASVEKPVAAKPVAPAAAKPVAPKKPAPMGDKRVLIAIAAIAIVSIAIAAFFMMPGGGKKAACGNGVCDLGSGESVGNCPSDCVTAGTSMPLMQIVPGLEDVIRDSKKITTEGSVIASISGGDSAVSSMSISMGFKAAFDRDAMKAYSRMTAAVLGAEQVTETYVIGNEMYVGATDPSTGGLFWMKQDGGNDTWSNYDPEIFVGILKYMTGRIVGSETINGKETQKIAVTPDLGAIMRFMFEYQYGDDLSAVGLTKADLEDMLAKVKQATRTADFTLWVEKGTSLPVKLEGNLILEIDMNAFSGGMATGAMEVSARPSMTFDFKSPVVITLPAEALNATSIEDLYDFSGGVCGDGICGYDEDETACPEDCGSVCGDGWCDLDENETNCPEDCGEELVGGDRDEHGCIPSAGYSWCNVTQKCIRPWEEGCNPGGCIDKCGNGTCEEVVCMAVGCPCAESAETCPEDCG